ncbi:unnamed protein product [Adineta steineri]|uniref:PPPDE domain-containing protein n=1 Tax=Adineta steineri TaxID=433720 RepID=A0A813XM79_9BILA|nr:unnamed protein product [Adineta steineri]CAF0873550.1 unnamed protein product [Adineta steineri]CAF3513572.1 unnamed protein product [Adineta steineri]CAF3684924.1 unnamed protein product [Adineta steineri]
MSLSINNTQLDKQTNVPMNTIISSASSLHTGAHVAPVYLNLYDLGGCINTCVHSLGLLFYHCAVQTHSAEYGYMGHPYRFTGLYKTSKHDSRFHLYHLRNSIEIGWTWFSEKEIDKILHDLKSFYIGCDYHTINKNSIHFAKYLLEQLSNDSQLKHLEPIKILAFPSYIDRGRRLTQTFEFLQMFDTEKDIAEINILYFLYMKYEGNMKQICQILKCDTLNKLHRCIKLIEHGIQQRKLPIFVGFTTFEMKTAYEYLYIIDQNNLEMSSSHEQITLTDIFHQFDTITLRGRTSIDRYLNIQPTKEIIQQSQNENEQQKYNGDHMIFSNIHRSSLPQDISHNQDQTPLTSRSISYTSGLAIRSTEQTIPILTNPFLNFEYLHMRTAIPIGTVLRLQETPNPDIPLTELHLNTNDDHNSLSSIHNRQRKYSFTSRKRKLPRDLELTNDLYTITNQNSFRYNHTNNATSIISSFSQCSQPILDTYSFDKLKTTEDIDSSV